MNHDWEAAPIVNSPERQQCRRCGLLRNRFKQRAGPGHPWEMAWGYYRETELPNGLIGTVPEFKTDEIHSCSTALMRKVLG